MLFLRAEQRCQAEQGADAVGADFGSRMQPAEGSDPGEMAGQDVLEKAAHPFQRVELDGGVPAGLAFAIVPAQFAFGQELDLAVGGGGLEHVTGEIAQGVFTRTGGAAVHVPMTLPHLGRNLPEQIGMFFEQAGFEERAVVGAQRFDREQEPGLGRNPTAPVVAKSPAWNQIMDVRMKDKRARPGVEHAQHAQLSPQPAGIGGQVLQGLGAGGKEQVQGDLEMRANEHSQFFRHREGEQEVGRGQQEARALVLKPVVSVGLTALGTMPVVAGMIAVVKARTVRALEELAAQSRSPARQNLSQDLPLAPGHGGAEALTVIRSQLAEPFVNRQALTTVAGGAVDHRSPMNSSSRF